MSIDEMHICSRVKECQAIGVSNPEILHQIYWALRALRANFFILTKYPVASFQVNSRSGEKDLHSMTRFYRSLWTISYEIGLIHENYSKLDTRIHNCSFQFTNISLRCILQITLGSPRDAMFLLFSKEMLNGANPYDSTHKAQTAHFKTLGTFL